MRSFLCLAVSLLACAAASAQGTGVPFNFDGLVPPGQGQDVDFKKLKGNSSGGPTTVEVIIDITFGGEDNHKPVVVYVVPCPPAGQDPDFSAPSYCSDPISIDPEGGPEFNEDIPVPDGSCVYVLEQPGTGDGGQVKGSGSARTVGT